MQKLAEVQFSQSMAQEWEELLTKEAINPRAVYQAAVPAMSKAVRSVGGRLVSAPRELLKGTAKDIGEHFSHGQIRSAWKGRGAVGAIGGLGGAAHGALTAEEGERGRGAVRGAVKGTIGGMAVGQLASKGGREQVQQFLQRQAHGLTGYMPRTQEQISRGMSRWGTGKGWSPEAKRQAMQRMSGPKAIAPEIAGAAARDLTSIPGLARTMALDKGHRMDALRTAIKAQGTQGALMTAGFGGMAMVPAIRERDPESMGKAIGETTGYMLGSAVPLVGNIALGTAGDRLGGAIGRGVGRVMGVRPRPQYPTQVEVD